MGYVIRELVVVMCERRFIGIVIAGNATEMKDRMDDNDTILH